MPVQKYNVKSSAKLDKLKRQLCKLFCYHTYILQGISYGLDKFQRAIVLVIGISSKIYCLVNRYLLAKQLKICKKKILKNGKRPFTNN